MDGNSRSRSPSRRLKSSSVQTANYEESIKETHRIDVKRDAKNDKMSRYITLRPKRNTRSYVPQSLEI